MRLARYLHRPVRMRSVQIRILGYHLGLYPDTEVQSQLSYLVAYTLYAARQLLLIRRPVTQGSRVVITSFEPAVVHNEQLDTCISSASCKAQELTLAYLKVGCLPGI